MGVNLRPHKVVAKIEDGRDIHALTFTEGPFSEIVFSYESVSFNEESRDGEDVLSVKFEYTVHDTTEKSKSYDKAAFEKELGDFLIELVFYGLERDKLGVLDAQH